MAEAILICGFPASGKSSLAKEYIKKGHVHLNRDTEGGNVIDLLPKMVECLKQGKNVVLDNLFPTVAKRSPFVEAARALGAEIHCIVMGTSLEDAQINALHRMHKKHGKLFLDTESLKEVKTDPNMFPAVVLFGYRKEYEKPSSEEGFHSIKKQEFKREPTSYTNKALILDYDDTLRESTGKHGFPTMPDEQVILPGRREVLKEYKDKGYLLLGVSNQSGIARKQLTMEDAIACFEKTNELLGFDIDYVFCPHNVPPTCYCRKPQSGLGVHLIEKHKLNPKDCIFVGDQTTDKTFAERLGFRYFDQSVFFQG